jgi:hypothetical protein
MSSDRPIIVQGGGSILVDLPEKFEKEEGGDGNRGGKFKNKDQDLIGLTVDGKPVDVEVKKNSRIEIIYGTRGGGKTAS